MEQLPDEIWLLVFTYLHQYDVLYSFNNLNQRFQKIIKCFASTINLSDLSYKLFSRFCREIVPIHAHQIYYLTVKDAHQLNFFRENYKLLEQMNSLQCLTLIGRQWSNELIDFYLKHFPSLNIFHLKLTGNREQRLEDILSNHLSLLTDFNLLAEDGGAYYFHDIRTVRSFGLHLPRLKILTIQNLKITSDMFYLFEIMCNLEELNLFVNQFDQQPVLIGLVTKSFNTMRLELTCTIQTQETAEMLRQFIFLFKKQLKSLKLFLNCTDKHFFVELHETLKVNLPYLVYFACFMEIMDPPTPPPPTTATVEDYLARITRLLLPKMTLQRIKKQTVIYLCDDARYSDLSSFIIPDGILLPKLRRIFFDLKFFNYNMVLYSKVLSISPNVTMLEVNHSNSAQTIDLLSKFPTRTKLMIKKLKCSNCYKECISEFHLTFLQELSQILPKLQYLNLYTIMPVDTTAERMLTPKLAIDHARKFLKNLIHLRIKLKVPSFYTRDMNVANTAVQKMSEELEAYLKGDQYNNLFYEDMYKDGELYIIDVWL